MLMSLQSLTKKIKQVNDLYRKKFNVEQNGDWFLLKLQEEFGEMTQKYLMTTERTRKKFASAEEGRQALGEEVANMFCYLILFAKHVGIDLEEAVEKKWFKYLTEGGK